MESEFKGEVYKIGAGQWSFRIKGQSGTEFCRGAKHATKAQTQEEMKLLLNEIVR